MKESGFAAIILTAVFLSAFLATDACAQSAKVLSLSQITSSQAGVPVTLWAEVQNTGSSALSAQCFVYFWVKSGSSSYQAVGSRACSENDAPGNYGTSANKGPLAPAEKRWYAFSWAPASAGVYKYESAVEIISGGQWKQISSPVESGSFTVSAPPGPEAKVTSLSTVSAVSGKSATLWAKVQNSGKVNLGDECFVYFWVSSPGSTQYQVAGSRPCRDNDSPGNYGTSSNTGTLSVGESRWYAVSWTAPSAGNYKYQAAAEVLASGKWKQISPPVSQSFTVSQPDVGKANIESTSNIDAQAGCGATLWALVKNTGSMDLDCFVYFWVRAEGSSYTLAGSRSCKENDSPGTFGSSSASGDLRTGEKRWYAITWTPPSAGKYVYSTQVYVSNEGGWKKISLLSEQPFIVRGAGISY